MKTIRALGPVGRAAEFAVPALQVTLASPSTNETFRLEAVRTLWRVAECADGLPLLASLLEQTDQWSPRLLEQSREYGTAGQPLVASVRLYWNHLRNNDLTVPRDLDEQFSETLQALGETDIAPEPLCRLDPPRIELPAWRVSRPLEERIVYQATTTFFDGTPKREDFEGLLRLLNIHTQSRKFAVSIREAAKPRSAGGPFQAVSPT